MTHSPSTRACVEREPSLARSSSEISALWAGPVAMARVAMRGTDATAPARVATVRRAAENMVTAYGGVGEVCGLRFAKWVMSDETDGSGISLRVYPHCCNRDIQLYSYIK